MRVHSDADHGPTSWSEVFQVFLLRVEKYEPQGAYSERMTCLLNIYRKLKGKWGEVWQEHVRDDSLHNAIPTKFLEEVRECWEETGEYLRLLDGRPPFLHYRDLAAAHISQAVKYPDLAEEGLKDDV